MNILIVDGNEKEASDHYIKLGMDTQYDVYSKVINKISNYEFNVSVVHPAITSDFLPLGASLDDFDGSCSLIMSIMLAPIVYIFY